MIHQNFLIDGANSDETYLYVDVPGYGTVSIKREVEGLIVDIYAFDVRDNSVATCGATFEELSASED